MTDIDNPGELRGEARAALGEALHEIKRVIVGQDAMLERLLVSLLAGGHVLLEGVPGLAKTLTVKTLAAVLGGSYSRIQFTPDLVPADLVGTRVYRPDAARFDTELGHKKVKHEVTAGFAGFGLVLLLLGSAGSLAWFGRLV